MSFEKELKKESQVVKDVWASNLQEELKSISVIINQGYTYVAMDTEFPGLIHKPKPYTNTITSHYSLIKSNVDSLKPIQIGFSFANPKGERPDTCYTWQFNLHFDVETDKYQSDSLQLLKDAQIQFDKLPIDGIKINELSDGLLLIGLPVNPKIVWLSFHGSFDFAYLTKILTGERLPNTVNQFNNLIKHLFPTFYDIKMFIQQNDKFKKYSLGRLAEAFNVSADGYLHQAGIDAQLTSNLFFKVKKDLLGDKLTKFKNKLFGLSKTFSANSVEFESLNDGKTETKPFKTESIARLDGGYALKPMNKIERTPVNVVYMGNYIVPGYTTYQIYNIGYMNGMTH